ncbi:MAG TPA: prolyl oligopeptidase family serine peptidase, partial [Usitatibacter sp.]
YPAVMLIAGLRDPRVEPWQAAKMAARLQAATTSGRPVLLRVDAAGGHGVGATRAQRDEERADIYAFLLWQMGDPRFQPPAQPLSPAAQPPTAPQVTSPPASPASPEPAPRLQDFDPTAIPKS